MGFRSTFITEDCGIQWPHWFISKWDHLIWFRENGIGVFSSKFEKKCYGDTGFMGLPEDIQLAINWENHQRFILVFLHECGGITRCQIHKDSILWSEPVEWLKEEGIMHDYCYGCSDVNG